MLWDAGQVPRMPNLRQQVRALNDGTSSTNLLVFAGGNAPDEICLVSPSEETRRIHAVDGSLCADTERGGERHGKLKVVLRFFPLSLNPVADCLLWRQELGGKGVGLDLARRSIPDPPEVFCGVYHAVVPEAGMPILVGKSEALVSRMTAPVEEDKAVSLLLAKGSRNPLRELKNRHRNPGGLLHQIEDIREGRVETDSQRD